MSMTPEQFGAKVTVLVAANDSAKTKVQIAKLNYGLHQEGDSIRFINIYSDKAKYCKDWNAWVIWDGHKWVPDDHNQVNEYGKQSLNELSRLAWKSDDKLVKSLIIEHLSRTKNYSYLTNMLKFASSNERIAINLKDFDIYKHYFNCRNAIVDLKTGRMIPNESKYYLTKSSPVKYDSRARCPLWESFLDQIMDGNQELIKFLQLAVGYSLMGTTEEQCLFILHGCGANGKSVFLDTLRRLFGDYATHIQTSSLMTKKFSDGSPTDIARLRGSRFVTASETGEGVFLDESLVKTMTGDSALVGRFLYSNPFEFTPEFTLWMATNHRPNIKGTDNGIWRRLRLIPFDRIFTEEEQDKRLAEKLEAELPGILNWAIEGCLEWQRNGLKPPREVLIATQDYRNEMDIIASFIEDCCIEQDNVRSSSGHLYDAYVKWCADNGERAIPQRTFGIKLKAKGFQQSKGHGGKRFWNGIGVIVQADGGAREA